MVARLAPLFPGTPDSLGARGPPPDMLLLSRRLLQSLLGRSAGVRRGRAAQNLSRRTLVPAHHAKCASLFSLSRPALHRRPFDRRVEIILVRRSCSRKDVLRHWNRHTRVANQCCPSRELHIRLSCPPPCGGRISRSAFPVDRLLPGLSLCELF